MSGEAPGAALTALPTMVRTDSGYRVFNPGVLAGDYALTPSGGMAHRLDDVFGGVAAALFLAPPVVLPILLSDGGFWSIGLWILVGVFAGCVLVGVEYALGPGDGLERHRKRTTEPAQLTVTHEHARGLRICALGERIAKSAAWRTGAFDCARRLEHVVWGAVRRAVSLEDAKADYDEDKRLGAGKKALAAARRRVVDAERELVEIEERLRAIKVAADAIEFKVDASRRPQPRPEATATDSAAPPVQEADLLLTEITTMRDYL